MFSNKLDEMSICTKKNCIRIPAGTKIYVYTNIYESYFATASKLAISISFQPLILLLPSLFYSQ